MPSVKNGAWLLLGLALGTALGLAVGEYRHGSQAATDIPLPLSKAAPPILPEPAVLPSVEPLLSIPGADTPVQTSSSLWDQVQALLASDDQLGAVRLLKQHLQQDPQSAPAWLLLAQTLQRLGNPRESVQAWFAYLRWEVDAAKAEQAMVHLRRYLLQLAQNPSLFGDDRQWLIEQLNQLAKLLADNGALHLALARLHLDDQDKTQTEYHALMALNDPQQQPQAELILAKLNDQANAQALGASVEIPLLRYGQQFLVEVEIEGIKARLLLDTGASVSGLTSHFLQRHPALVKNMRPLQLNTASGQVSSYLFRVEQFNLAMLRFKNHGFAHLPMNDLRDFDGLLGVDILGRFDCVIDQNDARLVLRKRASVPAPH